MQKLWSWIVDKKSHSIRKWRSSVLGGATRSQPTNGSLKPIGGSDDELERVQRRSGVPKEGSPSSQIVQDDESTASGELLAGLEVPECRINFEEFFDESADAIQIALVVFCSVHFCEALILVTFQRLVFIKDCHK
ncbi:unnamed protein product [Toxocara canis]|uniref:Uncharacterized protein n=1 Tax=Toxocara canis TaxID=6265 RepID=A0A183TV86_TOXCA|nr:unnamed protein product [Toxocara canis]